MAQQAPDREKALELALAQIDKNFGKGSVMRLGGVLPGGRTLCPLRPRQRAAR